MTELNTKETINVKSLDLDITNELLALANQVRETFNNESAEILNGSIDNDDLDFKLPEVDWINLEAKLKEAQEEINIQNKRENFKNDRDEIRRKLAIVSSSSSNSSFNDFTSQCNENIISDYLRKTSLSKTNYLGQNLQICFMNESSSDDLVENETLPPESDIIENLEDKSLTSKSYQIPSSFSAFSFDPNDSCDLFLSQHLNLQNETKQALAKVQIDVKREMEFEKQIIKKPSPIADIVGLSTYGVKRLEREHIVDMNIGQLQVIANDLCNQIEKINEDLKDILIDRDDLYMQQDALLVDIQDATKRIQEYAATFQKLNTNKEANEFHVSSSVNAINERSSSKINSNTMNPKNKLLQLGILTNKLFRFNKK